MATNEQNQGQIVDSGVTQAGGGNHCSCQSLINPMFLVRYFYAFIFLLANILTWVVRENPIKYFWRQHRSGCQGHHDCLAAEGVLTISLACCLFFTIMFATTVGTRTVQDYRNSWHVEWLWVKFFLLAPACGLIAILIPTNGIQLYGKVARFGAGAFLLIQLISVIKLITQLNYKWCKTNYENHYLKVYVASFVTYSGSIVGIILMIHWYTDCGFENIVFIVTTAALGCVMVLISRLSKLSSGFYMEPGLMGAYIVFLCWTAIKSEPDKRCFKIGKYSPRDNLKNIITFIAELMGITGATFSTGSEDYRCIHMSNVVQTENHVPYGYGIFHFVFTMGSMYFGMALVGWETHHTSEKWNVDVSWTSTWIHISNMHLAVISFVAVVIARRYGIGWLQELLANIFGIDAQQPRRSDMEDVPPSEFRGTEMEGSMMDNVPPQQSRATELEGSETDNRPPPSSSTELEGSEMDNRPPPPSSSLAELLGVPMSSSSVAGYDSDDIVEWRE